MLSSWVCLLSGRVPSRVLVFLVLCFSLDLSHLPLNNNSIWICYYGFWILGLIFFIICIVLLLKSVRFCLSIKVINITRKLLLLATRIIITNKSIIKKWDNIYESIYFLLRLKISKITILILFCAGDAMLGGFSSRLDLFPRLLLAEELIANALILLVLLSSWSLKKLKILCFTWLFWV